MAVDGKGMWNSGNDFTSNIIDFGVDSKFIL